MPDPLRHRILLLGSPASRPEGLERVLVRGGFQVTESESGHAPDFLLYTPDPGLPNVADEVRALATRPEYGGAPLFVLLGEGRRGDRGAPRADSPARAARAARCAYPHAHRPRSAGRAACPRSPVRHFSRGLCGEERRSAIYRRQISAGTTDELTGCASLDALDRRLRDEFERARRYSLQFALVLIDIDRLCDINERLGTAAGDRVLGEIGAILQRALRAPDFVARYGGDEFACVLPETSGPGGHDFIIRLRQVFSRHTFADLGPSTTPAITAGVAPFPHSEVLRPEDLFPLAEGALQKAKDAPERIGVVGEN